MPPAAPPPALGQTDPLVALADRCVQCGLCLPACPTYGQARIESESPRGRIALARAWAVGTIEPTASRRDPSRPLPGMPQLRGCLPGGRAVWPIAGRSRAQASGCGACPAGGSDAIESLTRRPRLLAGLLGALPARPPLAAGTLAAPAGPASASADRRPDSSRMPPSPCSSAAWPGLMRPACARDWSTVSPPSVSRSSRPPRRPAAAACMGTPATKRAAESLARAEP